MNMMTNVFNIFDPSTGLTLSLNWTSMIIIMFLMPIQFWMTPSRSNSIWSLLIKLLFKEFKIILKFATSNLIIFLSIASFIMFNNFMGLFPYIFTSSSHMNFNMSLSLNIWLSIMLFGWIKFFSDMMAHLTPQNTPFILMPFMVLIELTSLIIRPITLSIRLTANMIAGHLLLSLLGSAGTNLSTQNITLLIFTQTLLYILEIAVSLIQAYVFTILSVLYSSEI